MFSLKTVSLFGATAAAVGFEKLPNTDQIGDDASLHCLDNTAFCQRTREFKIDMDTVASYLSYNVVPKSVQVDPSTGSIKAKLEMGCEESGYLSHELELTM